MKMQAKVSISRIWLALRFFFRGGFKLYKLVAIIIGTFFIFMWSLLSINFLFEDEIRWSAIPLHSGFMYVNDTKDGSKDGHNLSDKNGKIIVYSDVKRFVESGNTIYGYRKDLQGNPFYFICDYGKDCSNSQNLTDVELRKIVEERHLPLYTSNSGMERNDFKRQLKVFYKKHGSNKGPKWEYDERFEKYSIVGVGDK
ncbi:hypothetical protein N9W34_01270 [Rickettsiales bacterium]|nr:hypothetical protein [Rickettsiales bacterium]